MSRKQGWVGQESVPWSLDGINLVYSRSFTAAATMSCLPSRPRASVKHCGCPRLVDRRTKYGKSLILRISRKDNLSNLFYLSFSIFFPSCKPIKMSKSKNLGMWAFRFSRTPARLLMNSLSLVAKAGRLKGWWQENGRRMASKCCLIKQHSYFVVWGMLLLSRMFKFSYHDGGAKRERWKQILSRQCAVIYNQQQCFLRS